MHNEKHTTYDYHDEHQTILYSKIRIEKEDGSKTFYWKRKENDTELNNINGCRKVLFNLPLVLYGISKEYIIFLVEGEKDVRTLRSHSLIATTAPGSLVWNHEFTQILRDANVVVLYDNDKTGLQRKELLCKNLYSNVKRLRIVDLPGLEYREKHGLDITDWFKMGNTKNQLLELVENTPDYTPTPKSEGLVVVNLEELLNLKIPQPQILLSPFLWEQGLVLLYAKRGVGKTHMALGIACAVASGGNFLKWNAVKPKKVLYIDGEMSAYSMQSRLRKIMTADNKHSMLANNLLLITPDLQNNAMPNLSTEKGRDAIKDILKDQDFIIIDNLSSLFRSGAENEAESWVPIQEWALNLRRMGKTIMFVHHAGKSGLQRGTSKREDTLDVVISLKQADNYKAKEGARFEVHFEKTRHFAGEDAEPFQAQLFFNDDGQSQWKISDIDSNPEVMQVAKMRKEGKTLVEIMGETNLTKSQVETRISKAKQQGLFNE